MESHNLPPQIHLEDVPRWYALAYRPATASTPPALIFSIRKESVEPLRAVLADSGFRATFAHRGLLFFESDITRGFGFERAMMCEGEHDGYVQLAMPLDARCSAEFYAANYSVLLDALSMNIIDVRAGGDPRRTQLMDIRAYYNPLAGIAAAPMGGSTAPLLRRWVEARHKKKQKLRAVAQAMRQAYNLFPSSALQEMSEFDMNVRAIEQNFPLASFTARMRQKGSFFLCTIGNACDISTADWWNIEDGWGHELIPHNLDGPRQQISLLCGLATLYDMAAKQLDPR